MPFSAIADWDDAYTNGAYISGGAEYPARWAEAAAEFRSRMTAAGRARLDVAYGAGARETLDLFLPEGRPAGLMVFIHGGYWMAFDKSSWSHLAAGATQLGFAVAVPSYTLCPENRISGITRQCAAAIAKAADLVAGPIHLTGHSAGGHLVARMACLSSPLEAGVQARLKRVVAISGVHDLRPLLRTKMNATLNLDEQEAAAESPLLLKPDPRIAVGCWVGAEERPEFLRQSRALADVWKGLGAATFALEERHRHHFNVIDGLADADHPLTGLLLG